VNGNGATFGKAAMIVIQGIAALALSYGVITIPAKLDNLSSRLASLEGQVSVMQSVLLGQVKKAPGQ
jgi:hypothetical protein